MAARYECHTSQITQWKTQLLEAATEVFLSPAEKRGSVRPSVKEMQAKIWQLALEHDFLAGSLERMFRDAGFERVRVEPYRHYASLRYIYRKLCAAVPGGFGKLFAKAGALVPDWVLPVSLGDVKLYVGAKR
jgi:hypothetical protein